MVNIKNKSTFKDESRDHAWFNGWVGQLEKMNGRTYERYEVSSLLGRTTVFGLHTKENHDKTLVIFPGARTTALIWDLDKGLDGIGTGVRIFMVETNGLPNLSDGATPDIKSLDYGLWAADVMDQLGLQKAFVAGASFGGLIAMKLGIVRPEKISAAFLLNPGCLQPFSLSLRNLYYNLLPIVSPKEKNIRRFLDVAIFSKPNHQLSPAAEKLLVDYEAFALTRYVDKTQKPYFMGHQLKQVTVDTYLVEGDKDLLFPFQKSVDNARQLIKPLKDVKIFQNVGHGIETYRPAMEYLNEKMRER